MENYKINYYEDYEGAYLLFMFGSDGNMSCSILQ